MSLTYSICTYLTWSDTSILQSGPKISSINLCKRLIPLSEANTGENVNTPLQGNYQIIIYGLSICRVNKESFKPD